MAREQIDSLDNFGIESSMEMASNETQLLDDFLFSSEGGDNPEDIEENKPKPVVKQPEVKKEEKQEEKKEEQQDILASFLEEGDEEEEEEEGALVEKKKETVEEEDKEQQEESETTFEALTNDLVKLGLFEEAEEDEEQVKTPEQFVEKFKAESQKTASKMIENFLSNFGPDYKRMFDAVFVKGADPKEYLKTYNEVVDFANLDISKEENQELVIRQFLLDNEFEEEDIDSEIEKLKNYGDLETTAAKHHKSLVKKSAQKLQQMEQEAQQLQQQKQAQKSQFINNVTTTLQEHLKAKDFDGIPLNNNLANEVQDFLVTEKWRNANGDLLTDFDKFLIDLKKPENHSMKVKVALLFKTLEKDPTLKTIQRSAVSKESNELFSHVKKTSATKKTTKNNEPNRWFQ